MTFFDTKDKARTARYGLYLFWAPCLLSVVRSLRSLAVSCGFTARDVKKVVPLNCGVAFEFFELLADVKGTNNSERSEHTAREPKATEPLATNYH